MIVAQYVPHVTLLKLKPLKWLGIDAKSSAKKGREKPVEFCPKGVKMFSLVVSSTPSERVGCEP
jgi:hypothetical protein